MKKRRNALVAGRSSCAVHLPVAGVMSFKFHRKTWKSLKGTMTPVYARNALMYLRRVNILPV
jgi:hypothetical protein